MSRARKNEEAMRKALASVGQSAVAGRLAVDEATVSRWKSEGRLKQTAELLDALGLKVVPVTVKCYDESFIQSVFTLAKQRMAQLDAVEELEWNE